MILLASMTSTTPTETVTVELPQASEKDLPSLEASESQPVFQQDQDPKVPKTEPDSEASPRLVVLESPYKDLLKRNSDYRGWVKVPGTDISYPFVKSTDNDYYLKRSFDQSYDPKGTIFMDYRNLGFGISQHILLYGHNMKDGSMFGPLKNYKDPDYALANRQIEIEDLYGTRYFKVYASYFAKADASLIQTFFNSDDDFLTIIDQQINLSDVAYDLIPGKDDRILTLVTCTYEVDDGRYFIHAIEETQPSLE